MDKVRGKKAIKAEIARLALEKAMQLQAMQSPAQLEENRYLFGEIQGKIDAFRWVLGQIDRI